jgi:deoxyribonuclease-4
MAQTPAEERLGVCLDTCHVFAAGYELRTEEGYAATVEAFDRAIGLERLKAVHLNDTKGELGNHKDRHEHIGKGHIGLDGFRNLLNDPRLAHLPGLLETPKGEDLAEDRENLRVLRSLVVSEA